MIMHTFRALSLRGHNGYVCKTIILVAPTGISLLQIISMV